MLSPGRRKGTEPVSDRPSRVNQRTVLERSAENVKDLLLNAVGVDLVLNDA